MRAKEAGEPFPFGATHQNGWWNFAVYSPHFVEELVIGDYESHDIIERIPLDLHENRTGNIWHIRLKAQETTLLWGWKVQSSPHCKDRAQLAVDPYARLLKTGHMWGKNHWHSLTQEEGLLIGVAQAKKETGLHTPHLPNEIIIYEAHVRGFTQSPSSKSSCPGTFLGMIDKLPHLQELGITVLELLPVFEFDETEYCKINPKTRSRLYNYWGYSPLNFFSPMQRYGTTDDPLQTAEEFKALIQAAHELGIAVVLDVVFNHTGEGNQYGPAYSWKIFDENAYYIKDPKFANFSGCGNTLNTNHPIVTDLIRDSLRHWILEYGIDGFRFDLASILTRNQRGQPMNEPSVLEAIVQDPIIYSSLLISEQWDAAGLYQTGRFFHLNQRLLPRFREWNDHFRDDVRLYLRGAHDKTGSFATRLSGSEDLYWCHGTPQNSINYITCHDGFTLYDLVSYNQKNNIENGENNHDGMNENFSWNCGIEGKTRKKEILLVRKRQIKNFFLALLISQGIPMMLMGDEALRSKNGNNNSWCQDRYWLDWENIEKNKEFSRYISLLIALRKASGLFDGKKFLTSKNIDWHGLTPHMPNWYSLFLAFTLKSQDGELYVAFNASDKSMAPELPVGREWRLVVNTAAASPHDIYELSHAPLITTQTFHLAPHSALLASI